ncbi:hypothetical protein Ddye_029384 [Dipteronia dyeriana]|uniref:Uncharacterized protein n=1 Tax=Dipteronia dyeriana TaxID=168575 RepID=A0AAD9WLF2_9ROSI|nr:hypothetical protein Ddye_029384 [Dipteronia dyeriana]
MVHDLTFYVDGSAMGNTGLGGIGALAVSCVILMAKSSACSRLRQFLLSRNSVSVRFASRNFNSLADSLAKAGTVLMEERLE